MVTIIKPYHYTVGRRCEEKADVLLTDPFLNDYNKILQSKAIRRLASKTQVRYLPKSPHVRNRRVHTDEVISTSMTISDPLGLNTHLCMSIAANHDIGHCPGGHLGEDVLTHKIQEELKRALEAGLAREPYTHLDAIKQVKFKHYVNSVFVAQHVERQGCGLNLCYETLEGTLLHSRGEGAMDLAKGKPEEYNVVMYADKIAYTFSDVNDELRAGRLAEVPSIVREFGDIQRDWMNNILAALIDESREKGRVDFSDSPAAKRFAELRDWMYQNVYKKTPTGMQAFVLEETYDYFERGDFGVHPALMVSLMTDKELYEMGEFFLRQIYDPDPVLLKEFGVMEILPYIRDRDLDFMDPDLGWEKEAIR